MLHILRPLPMPVAALSAGAAAPPSLTITSAATFSIAENTTAVATLTATGGTGGPYTWTKTSTGVVTTWNPSDKSANITLSGGNLTVGATTNTSDGVRSTTRQTVGKVYFEIDWTGATGGDTGCGVATNLASLTSVGSAASNAAICFASGNIWVNGTSTGTTLSALSSSTVCVAVDLANRRIWFRKDGGLWNNSGTANPTTNTGGLDISGVLTASNLLYALVCMLTSASTSVANFGASAFQQAVPSGFVSWNANVGDASAFSLTSGGVLTFATAPDFEKPADADANNVYVFDVQAADGVNTPATQTISVTVTDVGGA